MLGEALLDPVGVESPRAETTGLGLLPTSTTFLSRKSRHQVRGRVGNANGMLSGCQGAEIIAYEIHMGSTSMAGLSHPFVLTSGSGREVNISDGALDYEGLTLGTYLHGLFPLSSRPPVDLGVCRRTQRRDPAACRRRSRPKR